MAQTSRSTQLDSPNKRKSLVEGKKYQQNLGGGTYLLYRRPEGALLGTWAVRGYNPVTRKVGQERLGLADDDVKRPADGNKILDFKVAKEKAEVWLAEVARKAEQGLPGEILQEGPYTIVLAWADYLADATRRGVKGIKIMTQTAEAHIHPALGQVEVERLTRKQIEGWHVALSTAPKRTNRKPKADEEPEEAKDMTRDQERARRDTANRILTVLKALLNFAADRGRTGASSLPWRLVKPFKGTTSQRMRFLTVAEQKKLVAACDEEFRPLVMGALYTGGRYGELCAVKVRDFNATTKTLFIEWGKGKGDSVSRYVSLTPEAVTWFSEFTKGREPNELMWRRKAVARTKRAKTLADPDSWASYDQDFPMEKAVKAAGVERVTFHELRHTYASTLLNAGCPLVFVAQQLGHKDTRMCERHYGHIARLALAKSIEKLSPKLGLNISEVVKPVKAVKAKTEAKVSAT